jgi:hypothetical protein
MASGDSGNDIGIRSALMADAITAATDGSEETTPDVRIADEFGPFKEAIRKMEWAARRWALEPDEEASVFIASQVEILKAQCEAYRLLAEKLAKFEQVGQQNLTEIRKTSTNVQIALGKFHTFVETLRGDYKDNKLLGVERVVNNAISTLTWRLTDAMASLTRPPPRREWKVQRWMWFAGGAMLLFTILWICSTILGNDYRFEAIALDRGLSECIHGRVFGPGKKLFCPLADFDHNAGLRVTKLVKEIRASTSVPQRKP